MKPYGKKQSRGRTTSRYLDNGCPCCGRESEKKSSTRQKLKREIQKEYNFSEMKAVKNPYISLCKLPGCKGLEQEGGMYCANCIEAEREAKV